MKETKPTISDLLALCDEAIRDDERATPGPWHYPGDDRDNDHLVTCGRNSDGSWCYIDTSMADRHGEVANARFIAHARTREPVLARALREALVESARLKNAMRAILSGDIPTRETAAVCRHALGLYISDVQRELARNCYYEAEADHLRVTIPEDLKDAAEAEQAGRSEP